MILTRSETAGFQSLARFDGYPYVSTPLRSDVAECAGGDRASATLNRINPKPHRAPGLVVLDEAGHDVRTGEVGYRIVPEAAAEAVRCKD